MIKDMIPSENNEVEFLFRKIDELCHELEIKTSMCEKLNAENQDLKEKYQLLSDELCAEKDLRLKYANWYLSMANSTFWKLTKPLRTTCDYIKNKRH